MPGSTEKCPTQHASVAIAIIKYLPVIWEIFFSDFIQIICFQEPIEKLYLKIEIILIFKYI